MGNCMETSKVKELEGEYVKDVEKNKNGLRVKMVLTKEELQWLMTQLRNREQGTKSIEDVLREIEKGRTTNKKVISTTSSAHHSWKPSLDSINEIPELLDINK